MQCNYKNILNNHLHLSTTIFGITTACIIIMLNIKSFTCSIALGSKVITSGYRKTESSWLFPGLSRTWTNITLFTLQPLNLDKCTQSGKASVPTFWNIAVLCYEFKGSCWSHITEISHEDWGSFVTGHDGWMSPDNTWQKPPQPRGHGTAKKRKEEQHCTSQELYTWGPEETAHPNLWDQMNEWISQVL